MAMRKLVSILAVCLFLGCAKAPTIGGVVGPLEPAAACIVGDAVQGKSPGQILDDCAGVSVADVVAVLSDYLTVLQPSAALSPAAIKVVAVRDAALKMLKP